MRSVFDMLTLLTPYDIDKKKVRVGAKHDGGYILADDLRPDQTILSYGIANEISFDLDMANNGHLIYMFDPTIDALPSEHPNFRFFKEGIAPVTNVDRSLYSLDDHLMRHNIRRDGLVLKMDVEGIEWNAHENPAGHPASFDQIVMEIHGLTRR